MCAVWHTAVWKINLNSIWTSGFGLNCSHSGRASLLLCCCCCAVSVTSQCHETLTSCCTPDAGRCDSCARNLIIKKVAPVQDLKNKIKMHTTGKSSIWSEKLNKSVELSGLLLVREFHKNEFQFFSFSFSFSVNTPTVYALNLHRAQSARKIKPKNNWVI